MIYLISPQPKHKELTVMKFFHIPSILLLLITMTISGIISAVFLTPFFDLTFFPMIAVSFFIMQAIKRLDSWLLKEKSFFSILLLRLEESEKRYKQNNGIVCLMMNKHKNYCYQIDK